MAYSKEKYVPLQHAGSTRGVPYGTWLKNRDFQNGVSRKMTQGYISRYSKDFIMSGKDRIEGLRVEMNNVIGNKKRRKVDGGAFLVKSPRKGDRYGWAGEEDDDVMQALAEQNVVPLKRGPKVSYLAPSKELLFTKGKKKRDRSRTKSRSRTPTRASFYMSTGKSQGSRTPSRLSNMTPRGMHNKVRLQEKAAKQKSDLKRMVNWDHDKQRTGGVEAHIKKITIPEQYHPDPAPQGQERIPEHILGAIKTKGKQVYLYADDLHEPLTEPVNYMEVTHPEYQHSDLSKNVRLRELAFERRLRDVMYQKKDRKDYSGSPRKSRSPRKRQFQVSNYEREGKRLEQDGEDLRAFELQKELEQLDKRRRREEIARRKQEKGVGRGLRYERSYVESNNNSVDGILDKVESLAIR